MFIISLAIADLIVGAFVMPLATFYVVNDDVWTMCKTNVWWFDKNRDTIYEIDVFEPREMCALKTGLSENDYRETKSIP